jgi:hypothetical protein
VGLWDADEDPQVIVYMNRKLREVKNQDLFLIHVNLQCLFQRA